MRQNILKHFTRWQTYVGFSVLLLTWFVVWLFFPLPLAGRLLGYTKTFQRAPFESVISQIRLGMLQEDSIHAIILPRDLRYLTCDGKVYVTRKAHGQLTVFFPSWLGRVRFWRDDDYFEGYLFESEILPQQNIYGFDIPLPTLLPPWQPQVAENKVLLTALNSEEDERLDKHWFVAKNMAALYLF